MSNVEANLSNETVGVIEVVEVFSSSIFPAVNFPIEVFPQDLQKLAQSFSKAYRIPVNAVCASILTLVSVALGNTIRVLPKEGWEEALFIWLILIGKSGTGKSPCINTMMHPIYRKEAESAKKFKDEMLRYEKAKARGDNDIEVPIRVSYMTTDSTTEALAEVMKNSPRGILMNQDEISGFMLGLGQYKSKSNDEQRYLELFNCHPWYIKRKMGNIDVPNTGCGIIGGLQPQVLPEIFKKSDFHNGLVPRYIFTDIDDYRVRHTDFSVSCEDLETWNKYLEDAYALDLSFYPGGECKYTVYRFSETAKKRFIEFQNDYTYKMNIVGGDIEVFIPKLFNYCLKFSGILHFLRKEKGEVSVGTLEDAIKITDYFAGQVRKMLGKYGKVDKLNFMHRRILECLFQLSTEVKGGKLATSRIVEAYNVDQAQGFELNSEGVASIIKKQFGLKTEPYGSGGLSHLVWDKESIDRLFKVHEISSITSTTSTLT